MSLFQFIFLTCKYRDDLTMWDSHLHSSHTSTYFKILVLVYVSHIFLEVGMTCDLFYNEKVHNSIFSNFLNNVAFLIWSNNVVFQICIFLTIHIPSTHASLNPMFCDKEIKKYHIHSKPAMIYSILVPYHKNKYSIVNFIHAIAFM